MRVFQLGAVLLSEETKTVLHPNTVAFENRRAKRVAQVQGLGKSTRDTVNETVRGVASRRVGTASAERARELGQLLMGRATL